MKAQYPSGIIYRRDCSSGKLFNQNTATCEFSQSVQCFANKEMSEDLSELPESTQLETFSFPKSANLTETGDATQVEIAKKTEQN